MDQENTNLNLLLKILKDVNLAIGRNLNINGASKSILSILQEYWDIISGAVFILDEEGKYLNMTASIGYKNNVAKKKYKVGEGLTGKIAETGKPIIVPRVSQEPLFLNRLSSWNSKKDSEQSFIGTPITLDYQTLGTLVISLAYDSGRNFQADLNFLTIIASALLQPIRVQQVMDVERRKLLDENVVLKHKLREEFSFNKIIGNSHSMKDVLAQIANVARTNATVLLRGESGTGKELFAEAIHYNSTRHDEPFIAVNCAAIPENLVESEFFGYEKGAFTGAEKLKKGRFELADQGTIFLDEVGDLSPMTQVKLLRVLQEREFTRVGGTENIKVDVRIITATNSNLEDLIEKNLFREDLFYRLNVFSIFLPRLTERKSDITLLADHFMMKYCRKHHKTVNRISSPAIDMLMQYHWPGNVRELENCIERAVLVCEDRVIHSYHLPPSLQTAESSNTMTSLSLKDAIISYEKELIKDTLKSCNGNIAKSARILKSSERIIGYKIKKFKINMKRYRK